MRPATAPPRFARPLPHAPHSGHAGVPHHHPAYDPEIGRLFSELRQFLGLSIPAVAVRVAANPQTIAALEAGRLDLLPPWPETARVVVAYAGMAGIDPRAMLDRIAARSSRATAHIRRPDAAAPRAHPAARPAVEEVATPLSRIVGRLARAAATRQHDADREPGLLAEALATFAEAGRSLTASVRGAQAPVRWVVAGAALLILVASSAPSGVLQASVNGLSSPISGLWRTLSDQIGQASGHLHQGHRWIDADDPRSRRSDKLPTPRS